jgi:hypothetical protein
LPPLATGHNIAHVTQAGRHVKDDRHLLLAFGQLCYCLRLVGELSFGIREHFAVAFHLNPNPRPSITNANQRSPVSIVVANRNAEYTVLQRMLE